MIRFHYLSGETGRALVSFPRGALECASPGPCDSAVAFWQRSAQVRFLADAETMRQELRRYGAWEREELAAWDETELRARILWIAAGDVREELAQRRNYPERSAQRRRDGMRAELRAPLELAP